MGVLKGKEEDSLSVVSDLSPSPKRFGFFVKRRDIFRILSWHKSSLPAQIFSAASSSACHALARCPSPAPFSAAALLAKLRPFDGFQSHHRPSSGGFSQAHFHVAVLIIVKGLHYKSE